MTRRNERRIDVIILALTKDDVSFATTYNCLASYMNSGGPLINKIFVIETNKDSNYDYGIPQVEIIKPGIPFNYNQFYNIGLAKCTAEFVAGPNNDVVLELGCLPKLIDAFDRFPGIQSLSPVDRHWPRHNANTFKSPDALYHGYEVSRHFMGCMFCIRRSAFRQIGFLDENFYYFYQDDDISKCLETCKLAHALYTGAHMSHGTSLTSNSDVPIRYKYNDLNFKNQSAMFRLKWKYTVPFKDGGFEMFKEYTNG